MKFWITWKDIMNFEILKRHSWNLETTLWILKRYYEKHHKFWNLGTISMTLGTKLQLSKRHYEFWNDTTKDIMNFEILEYLERHREFWNLGIISMERYKPRNDTMNFETIRKSSEILEYLVRYYEFWNLGILGKTLWALKSWNNIHKFWNDTTKNTIFESFEILERHPWDLKQCCKPRNDTMNFETILWKSFKILEYLVRYYEFWNLGILGKTLWALKSWNNIHEFWNDITKNTMSFKILERHPWDLEQR